MAAEAEEPQEADSAAKEVEIDMEMVPSLPGGRSVYPAEQDGRFVWLVAEGAMTQACFDEMREYLRFLASEGLWTQHWGGKPCPGPNETPDEPT